MQTELTAERLRELLDYDPETGVFTWRVARSNTIKVGAVAGELRPCGYRYITLSNRRYRAHRLAWLHFYGVWPVEIDHIFGDRSDNRIAKLRDVAHRVNAQNKRKARTDSVIGLMGVRFHKQTGTFGARIWVGDRFKSLGYHATAEEAHQRFLEAKRSLHEGCTI